MTATATAPMGARQINQNLYVGQSDLSTIQKAVSFAARQGGGFAVIIPAGYAGADPIAAVTGGSATIYLSDQRGTTAQSYFWNGAAYIPAAFVQLSSSFSLGTIPGVKITSDGSELSLDAGPLCGIHLNLNSGGYVEFGDGEGNRVGIINQLGHADFDGSISTAGSLSVGTDATIGGTFTALFLQVTDTAEIENLGIGGNLSIAGTITGDVEIAGILSAPTANFDSCNVDDSPVRTFANTPDGGGAGMVWPPIGIAVSVGDHWQDPADKDTNTFTGSLHVQGKLKAYGWEAIEVGTSHVAAGTGQTGINPIISLTEADQPVDQRRWSNAVVGNQLWFSADTDAGANNGWLSVDRTGATATLITAYAPFDVKGNLTAMGMGQFNNVQIGPANGPAATMAAVVSDGINIFVNANPTGSVFLNWDRGGSSGAGVNFCNGAEEITATIFGETGNATFAGSITNPALVITQSDAYPTVPAGTAVIRTGVAGPANLVIDAPVGGGIYFNFDSGTGIVNFCKPTDGIVATVDAAGNGSFNGITALNALLFGVNNDPALADFNLIVQGGFHNITTTLPNAPPAADQRGFLVMVLNTSSYGENAIVYQIAMTVNSLGEIWFRMCYFGAWRGWQQVNATPH